MLASVIKSSLKYKTEMQICLRRYPLRHLDICSKRNKQTPSSGQKNVGIRVKDHVGQTEYFLLTTFQPNTLLNHFLHE